MPVVHRTKKREKERKARMRQLAEQQAEQFENELSAHELNILRLEAIPEDDRDEQWQANKETAEKAIATLDAAIEATLSVASREPDPEA